MAMSDDERAVQNIKDPQKRKEAFYTNQRRKDQARGGNAEGRAIAKKEGIGGAFKGFVKDSMDSLKKQGGVSSTVASLAAPEAGIGKAALGVGKKLFPRAAEAAEGVASKVGGAVKNAAGKLFPKSEQVAKKAATRRSFGDATIEHMQKHEPHVHTKMVAEGKKSSFGRKGEAAHKGVDFAAKSIKGVKRGATSKAKSAEKDWSSELEKQSNKAPRSTRAASIKANQGKATKSTAVNTKAKDSYVGARIGKASKKAAGREAAKQFGRELERQQKPKKEPAVPKSKGPLKPKRFNRDGSKKTS